MESVTLSAGLESEFGFRITQGTADPRPALGRHFSGSPLSRSASSSFIGAIGRVGGQFFEVDKSPISAIDFHCTSCYKMIYILKRERKNILTFRSEYRERNPN